MIVVYDEDEKEAIVVATTLVQRGYDNLFMLSGGGWGGNGCGCRMGDGCGCRMGDGCGCRMGDGCGCRMGDGGKCVFLSL